MRTAEINRKTNETDISLKLNLDGKGISKIDSGCGFLDHMLTLFARHGGFDLAVTCPGLAIAGRFFTSGATQASCTHPVSHPPLYLWSLLLSPSPFPGVSFLAS